MGNVIACYKWVVDEEDIRVSDDLSVDFSRAQKKIGDYDKNAIQASVEIAQALEGQAIGLTLGDATAQKSVKEALSRGLDELVWINAGERAPIDFGITASALGHAINTIGDVALVVCAEGSSDQFARQTPVRLAKKLGWPVVTCVTSAKVEGNALLLERTLDNEVETVKVSLPAVISVLPEIAEPPIPSLKQIMAAGKKPQREIPVAELAIPFDTNMTIDSVSGYASDRKGIIFDAGDENYITELIAALHKEGVI